MTYDARGSLTGDGQRSFTYDNENRLIQVSVSGAGRVDFVYDGLGRKRFRREYDAGGNLVKTTRYLYDGMRVIQERDGNDQAVATYTHGLDLSGSFEGAGGIGGTLARTDSTGASAYYHSDGGGNVTMLINASQQVVAKYLYDPFGNLLGMTGPLADANKFRFSSKEYDDKAGLYYYGERFYDPNFHRFVNPDPLGEAGGINLYGFNNNSPLNYIDPNGRWPTGIFASKTVHQESINRALKFLSESDRKILRDQQVVADKDQSIEGSFKHAMRAPNQTVNEARRLANQFIRVEIRAAQCLESQGEHREAFIRLGNAIHALQDATSPAHIGFQIWRGTGHLIDAKKHTDRENYDPGQNSTLDTATKKAYDYFKGSVPLPKDFFE